MYWSEKDFEAIASHLIKEGAHPDTITPSQVVLTAFSINRSLVKDVSEEVSSYRMAKIRRAMTSLSNQMAAQVEARRQADQALQVLMPGVPKEFRVDYLNSILAGQRAQIMDHVKQIVDPLVARNAALTREVDALRARVHYLSEQLGVEFPGETGAQVANYTAMEASISTPAVKPEEKKKKYVCLVFHLEDRKRREFEADLQNLGLADVVELHWVNTQHGPREVRKEAYDAVYYPESMVSAPIRARLKETGNKLVPVHGGSSAIRERMLSDVHGWLSSGSKTN